MKTVGIIGCGSLTALYYIPALQQLGYPDIYLSDIDNKRSELLARNQRCKSVTPEKIKTCDVIIIATPPASHAQLVNDCIASGKTIICEKPFVLYEAQANTIREKSKEIGCDVFVAHVRRNFAGIATARDFLLTKPLGKLLKADLFEGGIFHYQSVSGYVTQNKYGGVLPDTGSHVLDSFLYVNHLSGQDYKVTIQKVTKSGEEPSHEWKGQFLLGDIQVQMHLSRFEALSNKMNLYFEHGTVEVPLTLSPCIRVRRDDGNYIIETKHQPVRYISEGIKEELREIISRKNKDKFGVSQFVLLSRLLDQLYHHTS